MWTKDAQSCCLNLIYFRRLLQLTSFLWRHRSLTNLCQLWNQFSPEKHCTRLLTLLIRESWRFHLLTDWLDTTVSDAWLVNVVDLVLDRKLDHVEILCETFWQINGNLEESKGYSGIVDVSEDDQLTSSTIGSSSSIMIPELPVNYL